MASRGLKGLAAKFVSGVKEFLLSKTEAALELMYLHNGSRSEIDHFVKRKPNVLTLQCMIFI